MRVNFNMIKVCPLCKFDLTKQEERLKAFSYENTQPLWKIDNRKKAKKLYNI